MVPPRNHRRLGGKRPTRGSSVGAVVLTFDVMRPECAGVADRGDPTQEPRGASARGTSSGCVSVARRRDGHLWEPHVNATMKRERARDGAREQSHHRTFALSSILSTVVLVPLSLSQQSTAYGCAPPHPNTRRFPTRATGRACSFVERRRGALGRGASRRFSRESTTRSALPPHPLPVLPHAGRDHLPRLVSLFLTLELEHDEPERRRVEHPRVHLRDGVDSGVGSLGHPSSNSMHCHEVTHLSAPAKFRAASARGADRRRPKRRAPGPRRRIRDPSWTWRVAGTGTARRCGPRVA